MCNLVTNRSFNLTLNPTIKNNRKINFPYDFNPDFPLIVSDEWNAKNAMMLDVITDVVYNKINPNEKSFSYNYHKVPKDLLINESFLDYLKNNDDILNKKLYDKFNKTIIIDDLFLWKNYPFLTKFSSTQLFNFLNDTSKYKIKGTIKIRIKNNNGSKRKYKLVSHELDTFENIFNIELLSQNNGNYINEKYMKPRDRKYKIKFDSLLGFVFIQDIQTLNIDVLNSDFYSLPEFAQFIYRKLILKRKIGTDIILYLDDLKSFLALKTNSVDLRFIIEKNLKALEDFGLIKWSKHKNKSVWYKVNRNDINNDMVL